MTSKINMIRGDKKVLLLTPISAGDVYWIKSGDILRFRMFNTDNTVLTAKSADAAQQNKDTGAIPIAIEPEDTQNLDIFTATAFLWEAEIVFADGSVITPWHGNRIIIKPDLITPDLRGE